MPLTQLSELDLVHIARERIALGQLPRRVPERIWGSHKGTGELCALCGRAIRPDQPLLEIAERPPVLQFHVGCHAIWERECRARQPQASEAKPGSLPANRRALRMLGALYRNVFRPIANGKFAGVARMLKSFQPGASAVA